MKSIKVSRIFVYLFLIVVSLISIFPFYWIVAGGTNTSFAIQRGAMTFGRELGNNLSVLFKEYDMGRVLLNSLKISGISTVLTLLITSAAAYGFEIYRSRARGVIYAGIMLTMMVPFAALMVPLYKMIASLGLLNTHLTLIITSSFSVFIIFFFRQSIKAFPQDIIQSARVDGAGEIRIFFSIFMPAMKSTYFAAAIYAFMTSWNSYLWPLIVLQSNDLRTTTLLISYMSSAYQPQYGVIMLAIAISTLPIVIIFFLFQKQFVQGMLGSVKQ